MSSKRQQTMAKIARERAVREKRERKQEKKRERRLAAAERREGATHPGSEMAIEAAPDATGSEGAETAQD